MPLTRTLSRTLTRRLADHFSIGAGYTASSAAAMLAAEANGLALDFTDSYWWTSTSRYGSARVKDTTTPANNFDGVPGNLLTYTGTTKLFRQLDGVYRYGPHNLLIQSADPSHAAWVLTYNVSSKTTGMTDPVGGTSACRIQASTGWFHGSPCAMVAGASYNLSVWVRSRSGTQKVAMFARDGAVGSSSFTITTTWAKIEFDFTATANTTQHAGLWDSSPTNGATDIDIAFPHFRRTPSDSTYLATTYAARYGLPFEWNTSGVLQGILVEPQATNLFLNNTTGATQTITVSNATAYTVSFFGTGSITFSGANSSTLSGTGASNRVSTTFTTGSTSLVCTVSGSISDVQVETGSVATSVIRTYAASATRAADSIQLAGGRFPAANEMSLIVQAKLLSTMGGLGAVGTVFSGNAGGVYLSGGATVCYAHNGSTQWLGYPSGAFAIGDICKCAERFKTGDFAGRTNKGAIEKQASGAFAAPTGAIHVGGNQFSGNYGSFLIKSAIILPRGISDTEIGTYVT